VRQIIEKAPDVTVQNPVHLLPHDRDVQRIQRLMLAAPWPVFINLVEDTDHGLLNNLVLQSRDPERPLPTIRFWNENSSRWLPSVSVAVNLAVQIDKPTFQPGFILSPRDASTPGAARRSNGEARR
jgi:hypothetical protein